ncbi:MAG: PIN domain-containing protein, partial [Oxalobacteraceae bacterium]
LAKLDEQLVSTWPVMTETCHLLASRLGQTALLKFVDSWAKGALQIFPLELRHIARLPELMKKYADLPMDLADASLILLAEHLGHGRILTTDCRDFRAYRWKTRRPFRNLLLNLPGL